VRWAIIPEIRQRNSSKISAKRKFARNTRTSDKNSTYS